MQQEEPIQNLTPKKIPGLKEGYMVRLVPFESKYGINVFQWFYDPGYKLYFREFENPLTLEDCERFDQIIKQARMNVFVIEEKGTNKVMGLLTYSVIKKQSGVFKFGIMLDAQFQHKTHCIEALIILGDYMFYRLGMQKGVVEYLESDHHIRRISEKGGFLSEGPLLREALVDGEYVDEVRYCILKSTYDELYVNYFAGVK